MNNTMNGSLGKADIIGERKLFKALLGSVASNNHPQLFDIVGFELIRPRP